MKLTLIEGLTIAAIAGTILLMTAGVVDRAMGTKEFAESTIVGKRHIPAWIEHKSEWISGKDKDGDGDNDTMGHYRNYTVAHPDQYRIAVAIYGEQLVDFYQFATLQVGDPVVIARNVGRFSGIPGRWSFQHRGTLQPEH